MKLSLEAQRAQSAIDTLLELPPAALGDIDHDLRAALCARLEAALAASGTEPTREQIDAAIASAQTERSGDPEINEWSRGYQNAMDNVRRNISALFRAEAKPCEKCHDDGMIWTPTGNVVCDHKNQPLISKIRAYIEQRRSALQAFELALDPEGKALIVKLITDLEAILQDET